MAQINITSEQERKVLILAALHDTCESRTSDIPHDIKAKYPEMQMILSNAENNYYKENWEKYYDDIYEPEPVVHYILKLADAYSVYQWCLNEKSLGNNCDYLTDIFFDSLERIKKYTNEINLLSSK